VKTKRMYLVHWPCSYCKHYLSIIWVYDTYVLRARCAACKKSHRFPTQEKK